MKRFVATLLALTLLSGGVAQAAPVPYVNSTAWMQNWTQYPFPCCSLTDDSTPFFITRRVRLPADIEKGDVVTVIGAEEFDNESHWFTTTDAVKINGQQSEHWSAPYMGSGTLVTSASSSGPWTTIPGSHGYAENWDGIQHHWRYLDVVAFPATDTTASDYVAIRMYFARSPNRYDSTADFIEANPTYGRITAYVTKNVQVVVG